MPGKIISIEGGDGSGKETQTRILFERLNREGYTCEKMSFPRYNTPTGRIIGQCYLGKKDLGEGDVAWFGDPTKVNPRIASSYYAIDRLAALPEIEEIIDSGKHLILDRWIESNMAHQASKEIGFPKRSEIKNFIHTLEYDTFKLPKPDITIFLDIPFNVARELAERRGIELDGHESDLEYLKNTNKVFKELSKVYSWEKIECTPNGTIDSLRNPEDIGEEVYQKVEERI